MTAKERKKAFRIKSKKRHARKKLVEGRLIILNLLHLNRMFLRGVKS